MKSKAEKYADLQYKLQQDTPEKAPNLSKGIFGYEDIVNAFNTGRKSVVESIPELKWVKYGGGYVAETNFNEWYIGVNKLVKEKYALVIPNTVPSKYTTLEKTMQVANQIYNLRLKQALGL